MFFIQLVSLILLLFLLPLAGVYFPLKKLNISYPIIRTIGIVFVTLTYFVYKENYPSNSLFIKDFEENTSFKFPESANFKVGEQSTGDIYWNLAIVEVSSSDYNNLLALTQKNTHFKADTIFNITTGDNSIKKIENNISYTKGQETDRYTIGFSSDKKTVYLQRVN